MAAWYDSLWPLLQRTLGLGRPSPDATPPPGVAGPTAQPADASSARSLSPLTLAYLGDAVFEAYVRARLVGAGRVSPDALHQGAVARVRADAQARALAALEPLLTEEEQAVVRRARNAHPGHVPRGARPADYHRATAFEALLAHLLVTSQVGRLQELLGRAWDAGDPAGR
ncbi:MAG: Mini-ribonuclease 3 [Bacillota bacterium]